MAAESKLKYLVLGAGGYLGRHLVHVLRTEGHAVCATTRTGDNGPIADVGNLENLKALDWNVDVVCVFAGLTGTTISFNQARSFIHENQVGLLNVLECVRHSNHRPRVLFPSTRLVYKGSERALVETSELQARTVYASSKIACELQLQAYANAFDIPYTVARICVPYGNLLGGRYAYGTVGNFIQQALDTGRIRLFGDGSLRRSFTHVEDICHAIARMAERDDFVNEICNIPGEDLSLLQAAQQIATRWQAAIEFVPWPEFDLRIESGSTVFDGAKLLARLPSVMRYTMADWIAAVAPSHQS